MSVPRVYAAIAAVAGECSTQGIGKRHINRDDGYDYRSIDDLYERLSPLLAKHRLCILPRVLKRIATERIDPQLGSMTDVTIRAAFDLVSAEDGSSHSVEAFGEALDPGDKATAKAMTAAYKSAMFQIFCIPTGEGDEPDARSFRRGRVVGAVEPEQGWTRWSEELCQLIAHCETDRAVSEIQAANRELLRALALDQTKLFAEIGEAVRARKREIAQAAANRTARMPSKSRAPRKAKVERQVANA